MNAAIVTIESAAIMVWLTPTMIVRLAMGTSTLRSLELRLTQRRGRLERGRRDVLIACAVMRMTGGKRVDEVTSVAQPPRCRTG